MRNLIAIFILAILFICCGCGGNRADSVDFPMKPQKDIYVVDTAHMLDEDSRNQILYYGAELDKKYKAQIVVVTVDSLQGLDIEEYATTLFRTWGIGDKENNNGVLLLISKNDRKFRIEVGYGLEGILPDAKCNIILSDMKGSFQKKHFSKGIENAYIDIMNQIYKGYGDDNIVKNKVSKVDIGILVFALFFIVLISFFLATGTWYTGSSCGKSGGFGGGSSGGGGASGEW